MIISYNSGTIQSFASKMQVYSENITDEIKKIRKIISDISNAWTGDDASKYISVLQDRYILGLEQLKEIIDEYAVYLNNVPGAYELLDEFYSSKYIEI